MTISLRFLNRRPLWIVGTAIFLVAAATGVYLHRAEQEVQAIQVRPACRLDSSAKQVYDSLQPARTLVDSLSPALESASATDFGNLTEIVRAAIVQAPQVYRCGVAFDPAWLRAHPASLSGSQRNALGQFGLVLVQGNLATPQPRILYDYTDTALESSRWYTQAAKQRQPGWSDPNFVQSAQTRLVTYSRPLFDRSRSFVGVAFASMSLPRVRD